MVSNACSKSLGCVKDVIEEILELDVIDWESFTFCCCSLHEVKEIVKIKMK
jgi:hypothetical protein